MLFDPFHGGRYHGQIHPLLAVAAGTGDVLMSRLREGRANTARGAAHFLRETVGRVRYGGARGQLTVRADSGFYTHAVVAVCRRMDARFSITIRQRASLRDLIEAIPEEDWAPIPYWMDGAADVAETTYTPFQTEADAAPVRLIVRRVKPTPGSQLALFATYSYHGFITDRDGETLELEADHRRHAEIENAIRDLKYGVGLEPSPLGPLRRQRRLAVGTGDGPQPGPLDNTRSSEGPLVSNIFPSRGTLQDVTSESLNVGRLGTYWNDNHDNGGNLLRMDSCRITRGFLVIWSGPEGGERSADEWAARITPGNGSRILNRSFRESPGSPGYFEMIGRVRLAGPESIRLQVRGRFGQTWGAWSPAARLYCVENQRG